MSFNLIEFLSSIFDLTAGDYLASVWGDAPWVSIVLDIIGILLVATIPLLAVFVVGWVERKVLARMQDRIGPNRVGGKYGLLQMVADVVKMITKGKYRQEFWMVLLACNALPALALYLDPLNTITQVLASVLVLWGIYRLEKIWIEAPQKVALA